MSTFSSQDSADGAILSTVLSFDLVSWALVIDPLLLVKKRKLQHISIKVIGPHADKNSRTFAVTMYTNANVITLPVKPRSLSPSRTLV